MGEHPKLTAAMESLDAGDAGPLMGILARTRIALDEGRYCECTDPVLVGTDLMCGGCLLRNRDQEVAAVHLIVDAHDFVPDDRFDFFCATCTNGEDKPRHHGIPAVGTTSWGSSVQGVDARHADPEETS